MPMVRNGFAVSRRAFLEGAILGAGAAAAGSLVRPATAFAADTTAPRLAASPPPGFTPMCAPGRVVKVAKSNVLVPNGLWPKEDAARLMLERAMLELTGEADLGKAFSRFVHKDDKVAIKLNGISGQTGATMATNKELVLPIIDGVIAAGVAPTSIVVFEQYTSFLSGTRISSKNVPPGVTAVVHGTKDATMPEIQVVGVPTRFARQLTDATAVINVALIKDHGICGYTGCIKNVTHGCIVNPSSFHQHNGSPQIAALYAQDIVKSRVRLHITDGFKVLYDGGPIDKLPDRRVPHEAVYASTDPVAMDVIGWGVVEKWRKDKGLPTLAKSGREPSYIRIASDLGLGIANLDQIRMKEIAL
jgi:uncharacterized protein (DUF362 family)